MVATNQSGIGRGLFDMADAQRDALQDEPAAGKLGGRIDAVFFCPHTPDDDCDCRKPLPGLFAADRRALRRRPAPACRWSATRCATCRPAQAAGCEPHLVRTGKAARMGEAEIAELCAKVPGTTVHDDLSELANHLLEREHLRDSQSGLLA